MSMMEEPTPLSQKYWGPEFEGTGLVLSSSDDEAGEGPAMLVPRWAYLVAPMVWRLLGRDNGHASRVNRVLCALRDNVAAREELWSLLMLLGADDQTARVRPEALYDEAGGAWLEARGLL